MKQPTTQVKNVSPRDIRIRDFRYTVWGFAPQEVVRFLDSVALELELSLRREKERAEQITLLHEEIRKLHERDAEIVKEREKAVEEAEKMKSDATRAAEEHFRNVEAKAQEVREKTEQWLADAIAKIESIEQRKTSFITAFKSALDSHYALLNDEKTSVWEQSFTCFSNDRPATCESPTEQSTQRGLRPTT